MFKELSPKIPEYFKEDCMDCQGNKTDYYTGTICAACKGKGYIKVEVREDD